MTNNLLMLNITLMLRMMLRIWHYYLFIYISNYEDIMKAIKAINRFILLHFVYTVLLYYDMINIL